MEIESLQSLCANEIIKLLKNRNAYGSVQGCLQVYSALIPYFNLFAGIFGIQTITIV